MASCNSLKSKRSRSIVRHARKHAAARRIPFAGVITDRQTVFSQRYLRDHALPFAKSLAEVAVRRMTRRPSSPAPITGSFRRRAHVAAGR